jgi:hypothetical protein
MDNIASYFPPLVWVHALQRIEGYDVGEVGGPRENARHQ